jgi:hypothetical protein
VGSGVGSGVGAGVGKTLLFFIKQKIKLKRKKYIKKINEYNFFKFFIFFFFCVCARFFSYPVVIT